MCRVSNVPKERFVQSDEKGPAARRRPTAAREAYSLYVPLGGGLRPPSETSPQDAVRAAGRPRAGPRASEASNPRLRRQSRRESGTLPRPGAANGSEIAQHCVDCSASSAGFARATDSWGRLRRGPSRPPPTKRSRWALFSGRPAPPAPPPPWSPHSSAGASGSPGPLRAMSSRRAPPSRSRPSDDGARSPGSRARASAPRG